MAAAQLSRSEERPMIRPARVPSLVPFAALALALPWGACNCDDVLGQLPSPRAVLQAPNGTETPPLEIVEAALPPTTLGTTASLALVLRNDGDLDLEVADVVFGTDPVFCPAPSGAFSIVDPAAAPRAFTVARDAERPLRFGFTPTSGQPACTIVEVHSNDAAHPVLRALLRGQGDAPQLCTDRAVLDFGEVFVGERKEDVVRLESCGTRPITIQAAALDEQFPDPFTAGAIGAGTLLAPGDTLEVPVAFAPLVPGSYTIGGGNSGTISLSTDAPLAEYRIDLIGQARRAPSCVIHVVPGLVQFGNVGEGRSSTQTVFIRNIGELDCTFTSADVRAPAGSFTRALVDLTSGDVLAPQQGGSVEITFAPSTPSGTENGFLDVVSSDPVNPTIEVPLAATSVEVTPCFLEAEPTAVNFGNRSLFRSTEREVLLRNVGTQTCVINDVNLTVGAPEYRLIEPPLTQLSDTLPPPFDTLFGNAFGAMVPPGEATTIIVSFRPEQAGVRVGNVNFRYREMRFGASNQTLDVPLTGRGETPCITVTPLDVDYGNLAVGAGANRDVQVANCGGSDLHLRGINLRAGSHPDFSLTQSPAMPTVLAPGLSTTVTVRAAPTAAGTAQAGAAMFGALEVLSDLAPIFVNLRANAPSCQQGLQCTPTTLAFGEVNVGESLVRSVVCQNPGNSAVSLSPSIGAPFTIVSAPAQIAAGGTGVIRVKYTAQAASTSTGTLQLGGNTCLGAPATVAVNGTGRDDALPPCPQPQAFTPQTLWEWGENVATAPNSVQTWSAPLVSRLGDTNGDQVVTRADMPRVIFISFDQADAPEYLSTGGISGSNEQVNDPVPGILRAIDGATAAEVWTNVTPEGRLNSSVTPAIVDLDGDGCVEIIGSKYVLLPGVEAIPNGPKVHGKFARGNLLAFDCRGRVKWESQEWTRDQNELEDAGGVAVGDIDGDGFAEVAFGSHVYDHNGLLKWVGARGTGSAGHGPTSFFADVDGAPGLELIAGATVYRKDGSILWDHLGDVQFDGLPAVADLDGDGDNEVVFRSRELFIWDGRTGAVLAGPLIPPTRAGHGTTCPQSTDENECDIIPNNPAIMDVTGDGQLEIVVASQEILIVYDRQLRELWRANIFDGTGASGPAGFDFEADGTDNVIFADESSVWSFGPTGNTVYQARRASVTMMEYTPIADIDNDGHANLLAGSNEPQFNLADGLDAFQNSGVRWAQARGIWNQHAYVEDLISELGAPLPNNGPMPLRGFRTASAQCVP
jgi:hypothetical protein